MKKNLSAMRYEVFQTVFEEHVSKVQQTVRAAEALRPYHDVVREVLAAAKLKNDVKVSIEIRCGSFTAVTVKVIATPSDERLAFNDLAMVIGQGLKDAGLHETGTPKATIGGWRPCLLYTWCDKLDRRSGVYGFRQVELDVVCPPEGLRDYGFRRQQRRYVEDEFIGFIRTPRVYPHAGFRTVATDGIPVGLE